MGTQNLIQPFLPPMREEAHKLVLSILENLRPLQLEDHIRCAVGSVILKLVYRYTIISKGQDPFVHLTDIVLWQFSKCNEPSAYLVDAFPFLRYLPDWMLGSGFKWTVHHFWSTLQQFMEDPFRFTKEQMEAGTAVPSFTTQQLEALDPKLPQQTAIEIVKWAGALMLAGELVSMDLIFFLAMAKHQDIQHQGKAEIDAVVGSNQLPTFEDLQNLLYMHAIVKETLHWQVVAPSIMEDDVYCGWRIPKGSGILANVWKMMHDEEIYKDPYTFNPGRFLGSTPERDPADFVFGYGRRLCLGNGFAGQSLFITMATTLATLSIHKAQNEQGIEVDPVIEEVSGPIRWVHSFDRIIFIGNWYTIDSQPEPFLCIFEPHNSGVKALLRGAE
ncbi:hypothetical protein PILCRDRAFT_70736 [Piloderma croceum F 1598]|uniref:Cytochrome P450 n=1 Tax=Piloderma croceum (strain F 1598) TaxID=765440 RepID=A0A0C3FCN5_PILCF|nr:hypothetical protein PILCRDRAFT_70736 [Piloderma croceum F 1598]